MTAPDSIAPIRSAPSDVETILETIKDRQRRARYPEVFSVDRDRDPALLYFRQRPGTGLITVALRHGALTKPRMRALGEFRLDQYALSGFYNPKYLRKRRIDSDPDLRTLPPDTIHIVVGTNEGLIHAYSTMQPPKGTPAGVAKRKTGPKLSDNRRPWFPCEVESLGPDIFSSLPVLRDLPVHRIVEISILMGNQAETGFSFVYAVAESILAMAYMQIAPTNNLSSTIAHMSDLSRRVTYELGMPALFAPHVSNTRNVFPAHWYSDVIHSGRFWPMATSTVDVRNGEPHLRKLDAILDLPPRDLRRSLVELRRSAVRIVPANLTPEPGASTITWTAKPMPDDGGTR